MAAILAIWAVVLTTTVVAFARSPIRGGLLYLAVVLVCPTLPLGTTGVRIEHVLAPILLGLTLIQRGAHGLRWPPQATLLVAWLAVASVGTLLAVGNVASGPLSATALYTWWRPLVVILLFASLTSRPPPAPHLTQARSWGLAGTIFVLMAIPLGALSIGQSLGAPWATSTTLAWYTSPGRVSVANLLDALGVILRGVSVFETPAYAATYFLLAIGTGILLLDLDRPSPRMRRAIHLALLFALCGGILCLSATFVAGLGILALVALVLASPAGRRTWSRIMAIGAIVLAAGVTLLATNEAVSHTLRYQLDRVTSLQLLASRYSSGGGRVDAAIDAVVQRPWIGWGFATPADTFLGDSLYVLLTYTAGVVGLILYGMLGWQVIHQARRGPRIGAAAVLLWAVILLASGLGSPTLFILRLQDWVWAMVGWLGGQAANDASATSAPP